MSDMPSPVGVLLCPSCHLPKLMGVFGYAGPQCQCLSQPMLDVSGTLLQQSEAIRRLRAELLSARSRSARMQLLLCDIKNWDVSQYMTLPFDLRKRIEAEFSQGEAK